MGFTLLYFLLRFVMSRCVTLFIVLIFKKMPLEGDLIRVDLIRFPGSIPGDIRCALTDIH